MQPLRPFLDKEDYLLVGGRSQHSYLPCDSKHQLILPLTHQLIELINEHLRLLHAGLVSLKHRSLDICDVRAMCVYLPRRLDYALLCCYSRHFNPSARSPLNHNAKTVSTTPTTRSTITECLLETLVLGTKKLSKPFVKHSIAAWHVLKLKAVDGPVTFGTTNSGTPIFKILE